MNLHAIMNVIIEIYLSLYSSANLLLTHSHQHFNISLSSQKNLVMDFIKKKITLVEPGEFLHAYWKLKK